MNLTLVQRFDNSGVRSEVLMPPTSAVEWHCPGSRQEQPGVPWEQLPLQEQPGYGSSWLGALQGTTQAALL